MPVAKMEWFYGQHLDIDNENNLAKTDQESLDHIHQLKTGKT